METWVSVLRYGAKGDGTTDDTEAFEKAIAENEVIYVPSGWFEVANVTGGKGVLDWTTSV